MNGTERDRPVLIFAPAGRDAAVIERTLAGDRITGQVCSSVEAVVAALDDAAAAILVDAVIDDAVGQALGAWVHHQPSWSDFPFVLLAERAEAGIVAAIGQRSLDLLGNVTILERPCYAITLLSATRAARRARARQLELATQLAERQRAQDALHAAEQRFRHDLEALVEARTQALAQEVAERQKAQTALLQSQKMEAVGQLTAGIAHDFNNLLTIIRSSVDLLHRRDLPEVRRKRYIDAIGETVERAAGLTGQLLAFARRQPLQTEVFDAAERVGRLATMLRSVMGSRIQVSVELPQGPCFVETDPNQFESAIINMAVNARDAMNGEGALALAVSCAPAADTGPLASAPSGHAVAVAIRDSGMGIAPEQLERIFEPFYTTKEVGKGTGLGLSQVYGYAKQSGGDVRVTSVLGEGATFTLYLPQVAPPAAPAAPTAASLSRSRPLGVGRGRILVVEDNDQVGEFAAQLLSDLGYSPTRCANGTSALALLEADPGAFDLIFSDVVMPGPISGVELAREIRRRWPALPVVLTTGHSDVLAEDGAKEFALLRKPYAAEALSHLLRQMMHSHDEAS